ncbi:cupredoxin domain-containing protein [Cohnella zeiphila]|uniref:Cupredoxin domain-containing protein n=1 Tax=Cohnella zeiphila TaxID=2761120 RepID=A0A7X0SGH1_9BACL|nr:cupredoxin domain-containing protein [Cohnella zeiphila]MBB6729497.1 cupredoxin domain-containing protein [Cohnella zeiphila]
MKKHLFLLTTALAALMVVLSACGNSTSTSGQASPASSAEASTASASVPEVASPSPTSTAGQAVEIKLMAKDFEYDQKEIHVKKGDKVNITLQSDDGGHGFTIPDYNVTINGNGSAEFTADKAGSFEYHCSVPCGSGHTQMKGTLIVE